MDFLLTAELPYLINASLRLVILIFFIALLGLFVGLGIQKRRLALRATKDIERIKHYSQQLMAIEAGTLWKVDSLRSMRDLICLGRAFRECRQAHPEGRSFQLDESRYPLKIIMLKQAISTNGSGSKWGTRYQAIDTIANLKLHSLFGFLLQHSLVEKNSNVTSHCLHVCALLLRTGEEFDALSQRLDHDDQLSTNLVEGLSRIAIQQLKKNQCEAVVHQHLSGCLMAAAYGRLFKIGLINAIGKEQLASLKEVLIELARESTAGANGAANTAANTAPDDGAITLAVMRAIANFGQYDPLIRSQLESEQPTIQVVALRSSIHCDDESMKLVAQQLHSLHFDVRYAAAMTLEKMGARGRYALRIARMSTDRYAKNIAAFALAVN